MMFGMERNPARRFWQVWKPRWVEMSPEQMRKLVGGTA